MAPLRGLMEAKLARILASLILLLLVLVIGLDQWQVRRGEASVFGVLWSFGWTARADRLKSVGSPEGGPAPPRQTPGARVAVIIDDLGYREDLYETLKSFRRPLTLAVLPDLPVSRKIAAEAPAWGMEVLLHLPMEPYRYPELDPGPGALLMKMPSEELQGLTRKYLAQLPTVVGVNSHMGSKMTEYRDRMRPVLSVIKERKLLFVDSHTSNMSVAYDEARSLGVKAARRHVFLDLEFDEASERRQFEEVTRRAERGKETIAIGHGHPLTLRLLEEYLPKWAAAGARITPVSQLVD